MLKYVVLLAFALCVVKAGVDFFGLCPEEICDSVFCNIYDCSNTQDFEERVLCVCCKLCRKKYGRAYDCPGVEFVSRSEWQAREPTNLQIMDLPVDHIFIHQTETGECNDKPSCSRLMRSIQNHHMNNRNFADIGYNYLIGGDGRAYMGRCFDGVGAHTYNYNRDGIAFSLIGRFGTKEPSEIMLNTTKNLIKCAKQLNIVKEDYELHGHRDAKCTDCPGDALYNLIKTWDNFVAGPLAKYSC